MADQHFIAADGAEVELIHRLRLRDTGAAGDLYERYGALLLALILNIVGDRQVAEDLLAETLLKACNQIHAFDSNQIAVGSWLLLLTRNHALHFRQQTLPAARNTPYRSPLETPAHYLFPAAAGTGFLGSEAARKAFLELQEQDRLILELAWFEAMTFDEIALRLDRQVPDIVASAKAALSRIRES